MSGNLPFKIKKCNADKKPKGKSLSVTVLPICEKKRMFIQEIGQTQL